VLYARVGIRAFFATDRRTPQVRVKLADGTTLDAVHFAIVTNCDPWTFVGPVPLRPTPHTDFDTGLGLYARKRMGTAGMLFSMGAMMGPPARVGDRGATLIEDLDRLDLSAAAPLPFQIDGDAVDHRDRVSLRSVPRAVRVAL
jgi:diacylglycerol kinase family enzyme